MFVTRWKLCTAVTIAFAMMTVAMTTAAMRAAAADPDANPQWPAIEGRDAQWPNLRPEDLPS